MTNKAVSIRTFAQYDDHPTVHDPRGKGRKMPSHYRVIYVPPDSTYRVGSTWSTWDLTATCATWGWDDGMIFEAPDGSTLTVVTKKERQILQPTDPKCDQDDNLEANQKLV